MKIFQIERNSDCPCGSGRKYKRCCQGRVDDATRRISQAVGVGSFTAEGLEVIETLGFLCGLQAEGGHMPAPERLGQLLQEAWDEEDEIQYNQDEGALSALSMAFQVLLGEKHQLRSIRIPVWQFELEFGQEYESEDEEIELIKEIIDYLVGPGGREFMTEALKCTGMSLLYDDYTDGELKTLLAALGWLVVDDTRDLFLFSVLYKTRSDLMVAAQKVTEIMEKYGEDDQEELYQEMRSILFNYPVYDQMLSDKADDDINFVMEAVANDELNLDVSLFSVLQGIYVMISKAAESSEALLSSEDPPTGTLKALAPMEEVLFPGGEYRFFFPEVLGCLDRELRETDNSELRDSLNEFLFFLILLSDTKQIAIIKYLHVRCICAYLGRLPVFLPEADLEFKVPADYCDQNIIEKYACYLGSRDMTEEAVYVRNAFETLGEQAQQEAFLYEDEVIDFARLLLEEDEEEE
jgi:hypothetical protein